MAKKKKTETAESDNRTETTEKKTRKKNSQKEVRAGAAEKDIQAKKPGRSAAASGQKRAGGVKRSSANSPAKETPETKAKESVKITRGATVTEKGRSREKKPKLRIIPLGGLGEVGKNMTVFEYGDDLVIIDCGLAFPDEDMFGVDRVIPDFAYLESVKDKIRGVLLTHGHEDHIGAVPYFLERFPVPVYGTALTLGIIRNKLREHKLGYTPSLVTVNAGDKVKLGVFEAEFIHVNHSIADACAIALQTPVGTVVHSGDFKLDVSPIDEDVIDLTRFGELGRRGVRALLCESTNAERSGFTPSEKSVGGVLESIFESNPDKRIVVATFSSNVHRVKQVIDISVKLGRKVAVTGRSMLTVLDAATELGYMKVPPETVIDVSEMKYYSPGKLTLITTGSQGEPMSALYRMAFSERTSVTLGRDDVVVLSSSTIPGNEKLIGRIINELTHNGIKVINGSILTGVHTSGHACAEEIKLLIQLCRPQVYIPVHGEYRHLEANRGIAAFLGIPSDRIVMSDIGDVIELGKKDVSAAGSVPSGRTLIDGFGVGDVGKDVLRDRKHLSEDGIVIVYATVDYDLATVVIPPVIEAKGFVYAPDSEDLLREAELAASDEISAAFDRRRGKTDPETLKERVRRAVLKFLSGRTGRNPMVVPLINEL